VALLAGFAVLRLHNRKGRAGYGLSFSTEHRVDALLTALQSAESINAFEVGSFTDPRIRLEPIVRLAPTKYQDGVLEIHQSFKEGRVVSVDLSRMNASQAARLVDSCSGILLGASGWLFRATGTVIVLIPTKQR
jgi:FtsZ-interacting cell division protein YlmF